MMSTGNILKEKLDEFIRKYYLNRMVQGLLLGIGGLVAFFLLAAIAEYFGHFGVLVRTVLFFAFVFFSLMVLLVFIAIPFLRSRRIGKTMDYREASALIGSHFPEISDKLLNTLQLQEQATGGSNELLTASIEQRIRSLSPFRFSSAVDFRESLRKYGKFTLLPVTLLLVIVLFQSSIITRPAGRILSYNRYYEKEAPFRFVLLNSSLELVRNSDITLEVELKGKKIPAQLFLRSGGHDIRMESNGRNRFVYRISNVTRNQEVVFTDGEYESRAYTVKVLPNPSIRSFRVKLSYPSYTGRKEEWLENTGDITVPEGTSATWQFQASDAEEMVFTFDGKVLPVRRSGEDFGITHMVRRTADYSISLKNREVVSRDTIHYRMQAIADRYPGIAAEQKPDSLNPFRYYFYGKADDDYGISKLNFVYRKPGDKIQHYLPVPVGKGTDEIFYYMIDLNALDGAEGGSFEYFFEVWDNDGVNGKKSSRSQVFKAVSPDRQELRTQAEKSSNSLKNKMSETMKEIAELEKKTAEISKELTESRQLEWQQQQKIRDLISRQKKLQEKIEQVRKEKQLNDEKDRQTNPPDEELLQKQKELEKLFNELMTPEMKEMLKKLEEMLKQQNKEAIQKQMEQMKQGNDDMKKQMDRALEQMKQLELEKRIREEVAELRNLAEKQRELAAKASDKNAKKEDLMKEQQELSEKFEALSKEIEKTQEKNKDLESPLDLENMEKDRESVKENMQESMEELGKRQNKKASERQKQTSEEMEQLAERMEKSLEKAQEKQEEEDYFTLRQILENLIELSLQQEEVMNGMKEMRSYGPKYVELSSLQRKLKENTKVVEDSLFALSKRQIQIRSIVNKEISQINQYMDGAIDHFSKVHIQNGVSNQQYVMTGMNNLAVLLSESLKNMQESMSQKKNKSGAQCKNPGKNQGKPGSSGKPKMSGMKQQQDQINKMLKEMQQGKQQGKTPGSEQFARIAAQQEALRREMERLQKLLKEEGKPGALGDLEKTKQLMEQQEKDLVNKQVNPETIKRMQEIETRMLQHEKAEREQETDMQREAEQAEEIKNEMPPAIREYLEKKAREMELLRSVPMELSPYYKDRVRLYFNKVGNE